MLARDAPGRLTMLECRFNKTTHHPKYNGCYLALACLRRLGVSPRPPRNETGGGDLWLLGYTRQGLGAKAQIWGNRKVGVRHHLH